MIRTKIQIRWGDVDALRHVYNGQYQHFFDLGKSDYFARVLGVENNWAESGEGFITARTVTNYYSQTLLHEEIEVLTTLRRVGTKSFDVFQRMVNSTTGELKADSLSVTVCYNPITKESYAVPSELREVMESEILLKELND